MNQVLYFCRVTYEKEVINMGDTIKKIISFIKILWKKASGNSIISGCIVGITVAVVTVFLEFIINGSQINQFKEDYNSNFSNLTGDINASIQSISEDVTTLSNAMDTFQDDIEEDINKINGKIDYISGILGIDPIIIAADYDKLDFINQICNYGEYNIPYYASGIEPTEINTLRITDENTGNNYSATELIDQIIIFCYTDSNGDEVFFKGQYDETGKWYGNCVVNKYRNNQLISIFDGNYNSGVLSDYYYISSYNNSSGYVWSVSKRYIDDDTDKGDVWTYYKDEEILKDFEDGVVAENIISAEEFISHNELSEEGFYHGNIANGRYNDKTGESYMIKYDENGFIRMLYVGNVVNGDLVDDTGNAWYIVRDSNSTNPYMYYIGIFEKGTAAEKPNGDNSKNPIDIDFINDIIQDCGIDFETELNWYINSDI